MLSGGKDSVYMLSQMVRMHGKRVLAYTFNMAADLEAPVCVRNTSRTVKALGVEWKAASCDALYLQAMRRVFSESNGTNAGQFWWGITKQPTTYTRKPCRICTSFIRLLALKTADELRIPYVIYCADPRQGRRDEYMKAPQMLRYFEATVGEDLSTEVFGDWRRRLLDERSAADLPEWIYPYWPSNYDPSGITAAVRAQGLYEGSMLQGHCRLYALLNVYSFSRFGHHYYADVYAEPFRKIKSRIVHWIAQRAYFKLDRALREVFFSYPTGSQLTEDERNAIRRAARRAFPKSFPDAATDYVAELCISMRETAAALGLDIDEMRKRTAEPPMEEEPAPY